jgi:hypothetical protein
VDEASEFVQRPDVVNGRVHWIGVRLGSVTNAVPGIPSSAML